MGGRRSPSKTGDEIENASPKTKRIDGLELCIETGPNDAKVIKIRWGLITNATARTVMGIGALQLGPSQDSLRGIT